MNIGLLMMSTNTDIKITLLKRVYCFGWLGSARHVFDNDVERI
jgi:hypothetical protein